MSIYKSHDGVAAFHQKSYPKRRLYRYDDFRQVVREAAVPVQVAPDFTYQEFINGDFVIDAAQRTA